MKKTIKKYICGVDFQHEFDQVREYYPSIESLKKHRPCWEGCGIVELEVRLKGWVEKQDLGKGAVSIEEWGQMEKKDILERIETLSRQIEVLKLQMDRAKE